MSVIYIAENGAHLGKEANRLTIKYKDGLLRSLPIETIDGITLLGKAQLTTQCIETCMSKGIPVSFFSKGDNNIINMQNSRKKVPEAENLSEIMGYEGSVFGNRESRFEPIFWLSASGCGETSNTCKRPDGGVACCYCRFSADSIAGKNLVHKWGRDTGVEQEDLIII